MVLETEKPQIKSISISDFTNLQWFVILSTAIIDVIVGALFILSTIPAFIVAGDILAIYLSWVLGGSLIALPTTLLLKIGWPERISAQTLLLPLRLGFGYLFLHGGIDKLFLEPTYLASPGLIAAGAFGAPSPWVQSIMGLMMGNYAIFLLMIAIGELLVGLSMLTGSFTRLGAIGGIMMQLVFLFLLGWLSASTFSANLLGPLALGVLGAHRAGRSFGMDKYWGEKLENSNNSLLKLLGKLT